MSLFGHYQITKYQTHYFGDLVAFTSLSYIFYFVMTLIVFLRCLSLGFFTINIKLIFLSGIYDRICKNLSDKPIS